MHMMRGRMCVWWEQTPGIVMRTNYHNIDRYIQFLSYEKRFITYRTLSDNIIHKTEINTFICNGGALSNIFPDRFLIKIKWKYNIGDIINGHLHDIQVIDREIRKRIKKTKKTKRGYDILNEKWYRCKCLDCGFDEIWIREDRPEKWIGCQACSGQVVVKGYNDLATTHPNVLNVLTNPEEAYEHTVGEHAWLNTTCPICGYVKDVYISNIAAGKYVCDNCSDGISYPEKFMFKFLQLLGEKFIYQYRKIHAEWCNKYMYDFYLVQKDAILEVHGLQHYKQTTWYNYESITKNDINKKALASDYVSNYIIIDARYSDKDYIRNSIGKSVLNDWFDLSCIDWDICDEYATKSYVLQAINYWNDGLSICEIAEKISLSTETIKKYLKKVDKSKQKLIKYNNRVEAS